MRELAQFRHRAVKRPAEAVDRLIDLAFGNAERRRERNGFGEPQRADQQALVKRIAGDNAVRLELRIEKSARSLVGDKFDPDHQAFATDVADKWVIANPVLQPLTQIGAHTRRILDQPLALDDIEIGHRHRPADRVA